MPTSKPRITVTLTEHQHAILRRISDAGGRSMSGVISEFMVVAQPTLERMADAFQQLKQDLDTDHQHVADMLSGLHAKRNRGRRVGDGVTPSFPAIARSASDQTDLTVRGGEEAIQYCASVDTARPDNLRSHGSSPDESEIEAVYGKRKKIASRKTNRPAMPLKDSSRNGKK